MECRRRGLCAEDDLWPSSPPVRPRAIPRRRRATSRPRDNKGIGGLYGDRVSRFFPWRPRRGGRAAAPTKSSPRKRAWRERRWYRKIAIDHAARAGVSVQPARVMGPQGRLLPAVDTGRFCLLRPCVLRRERANVGVIGVQAPAAAADRSASAGGDEMRAETPIIVVDAHGGRRAKKSRRINGSVMGAPARDDEQTRRPDAFICDAGWLMAMRRGSRLSAFPFHLPAPFQRRVCAGFVDVRVMVADLNASFRARNC